jgi:hypothetical protein
MSRLAPLPAGFEWAAPGLHPDAWCIRRTGAEVLLCGRLLHGSQQAQRGLVPVLQPYEIPDGAHQRCMNLAAAQHGVCPVCGGDVATDGGLLVEHGMWRVTRNGIEATDEPCPGAGQESEAES